jgi:histidine triad (HIT) family protein
LDNCIFCRIAQHTIPAKIVFEDETVVAFEDLNPQAPVHLLVIPRKHLASLRDAGPGDEGLLGHLFAVSAELARARQIDSKGYRTVINSGEWGGQTVFHLHVHLMGGRIFHWPPG